MFVSCIFTIGTLEKLLFSPWGPSLLLPYGNRAEEVLVAADFGHGRLAGTEGQWHGCAGKAAAYRTHAWP